MHTSFRSFHLLHQALLGLSVVIAVSGCRSESTEQPAMFEPNLVHTMKYEIQKEISMDQVSADTSWVMTKLFGTPDDPKLPEIVSSNEDFTGFISLDHLQQASGPDGEAGRGLYRKHCVVCHGVTGNGRGPTAAVQVPYPRDYRMGIFKFKSTPRGSKPTKADLHRLIANGIGGTAMIKIAELSDQDIDALVDYVIYLAWRGETERAIIDDAMFELDIEGGDRILNTELAAELESDTELSQQLDQLLETIDGEQLSQYEDYLEFEQKLAAEPDLKSRLKSAGDDDESLAGLKDDFASHQEMEADLADDAELADSLAAALKTTTGSQLAAYEAYTESWEIIQDFVLEIGQSWLDAPEDVIEVPEPPADLPLAEDYQDVLKIRSSDQAEAFEASVKRGQELFVGKIAACSKCHGEKGLGNGQTTDYDDWTKDWTTRVGLQPEDNDAIVPLLARGALPPRNAIPRNFAEGVFRGGSSSDQLYRRITQGIDGTPMPAVTFVAGEFEQADVWHLINFIRSLQTNEERN